MKKFKTKLLGTALVTLVIIQIASIMCIYAAPRYIVTDNKAYDLYEAPDDNYRMALIADVAGASNVYIGDDTGKTVSILELTGSGSYDTKVEQAPNIAHTLKNIRIVNRNLTLGEIIVLPGGTEEDLLEVISIE